MNTTLLFSLFFFFFNDTATTEIYTLSLHDALPISASSTSENPLLLLIAPESGRNDHDPVVDRGGDSGPMRKSRSEEHTSELQSRLHLVCRLLLEKKKKKIYKV